MKRVVFLFFCFSYAFALQAQTTPLLRSTTGIAGSSSYLNASGKNSLLFQQSVGQASPIGTVQNASFVIRQGFIQPYSWIKESNTNNLPILQAGAYPNPFENELNIVFNEHIVGRISVELFDAMGKRVILARPQATQYLSYSLNHLAAGKYLLRIIANNKLYTEPLIKRK